MTIDDTMNEMELSKGDRTRTYRVAEYYTHKDVEQVLTDCKRLYSAFIHRMNTPLTPSYKKMILSKLTRSYVHFVLKSATDSYYNYPYTTLGGKRYQSISENYISTMLDKIQAFKK